MVFLKQNAKYMAPIYGRIQYMSQMHIKQGVALTVLTRRAVSAAGAAMHPARWRPTAHVHYRL